MAARRDRRGRASTCRKLGRCSSSLRRCGFVFLDAPGGSSGAPSSSAQADRRGAARGLGRSRHTVRDPGDLLRRNPLGLKGRRRALSRLDERRGRIRHEHDDAQLQQLRPGRGARFRAGREDPDHGARPGRKRGGTLARTRCRPWTGAACRRSDGSAHGRSRRSGVQAERAHARRRLRARLERHGVDRRCAPHLRARTHRRRTQLDRRRPLRCTRAAGRHRDRLRRPSLLALQVLRAAPRRRVHPCRERRGLAPLQGDPSSRQPTRTSLRDRDSSLRAAGGLPGDDRLPRLTRRARGAARLRTRARRAPARLTPRGRRALRPRRDRGARPGSFLLNVAGHDAEQVSHALARDEVESGGPTTGTASPSSSVCRHVRCGSG